MSDKKTYEVEKEDLRLLIIGTFRCSINRQTYMPSFSIEMVKKYIDVLTDDNIQNMLSDIAGYYSHMSSIEKELFNNFKKFLEDERYKRKNRRSNDI